MTVFYFVGAFVGDLAIGFLVGGLVGDLVGARVGCFVLNVITVGDIIAGLKPMGLNTTEGVMAITAGANGNIPVNVF